MLGSGGACSCGSEYYSLRSMRSRVSLNCSRERRSRALVTPNEWWESWARERRSASQSRKLSGSAALVRLIAHHACVQYPRHGERPLPARSAAHHACVHGLLHGPGIETSFLSIASKLRPGSDAWSRTTIRSFKDSRPTLGRHRKKNGPVCVPARPYRLSRPPRISGPRSPESRSVFLSHQVRRRRVKSSEGATQLQPGSAHVDSGE